MSRHSLPNRREAETISFEIDGLHYTGTLGRFDNGNPAEIFLNCDKRFRSADTAAHDAGIAASLALQFGCPLDTLRKALTRNADNSAIGPLGKFLDLIDKPWSTPPTPPKRESSDDARR